MATGGHSAPDSDEERRESLKCSVCLEIFTCPKRLPCDHMFCLRCLQDLASRHESGSFPCPQCRREADVPSGGVSAFPNNVHIVFGDLAIARNEVMCDVHPNQEVDMYCADCQTAACCKCLLTEHKRHDHKDLHEAANEARRQLTEDEARLKRAVSYMTDEVSALSRERQSAQDKAKAVKTTISRKLQSVMSLVMKLHDDELKSLETVSSDIDSQLSKDLDSRKRNLDQLCQLQQQLQGAIKSGTDREALAVAMEIREGRGSAQAVSDVKSLKTNSILRPVLSCKVTEEVITPVLRDFFGSVEEVKMEVTQLEVKIVEQFHCGEEDDIEVFCICPKGDVRKVGVSFAWRGMKGDSPCVVFDDKGEYVATYGSGTGKVSLKCMDSGKVICLKRATDEFITFNKSQKKTIYCLHNTFSGEGVVKKTTIKLEDPRKAVYTPLFKINVGRHRAFDVDSSEQFFIVLEEGEETYSLFRKQNKVRLYRRGQPDAVDTYRPPSATCRPSDACFWRQPDGREILVVADEGTDSLHMLDVQGGKLRFEGYLAAGSPLIVQPTALNTDTRGRLWVALRGGQIVTLSAVTP